MSDFNDFGEYYRSLSDRQIIEILQDNADRYQPEALIAAKNEFERRRLGEKEIEAAQAECKEEEDFRAKKSLWRKKIVEKVETTGGDLIDILQPIQKEKPGVDRIIKALCILWGAVGLFQLYYIVFRLNLLYDNFFTDTFFVLISILPSVILIIAVVFFWKRHKLGWTLFLFVCFIFTLNEVMSLVSLIESNRKARELQILKSRYSFNITAALLWLTINIFTITVLLKSNFLTIYEISKKRRDLTVLGGIIFTLFLYLLVTAYY